jgi:hypothetical protein
MSGDEVVALETQARSFGADVQALRITDAERYAEAGALLKAIAVYVRRVGEVLDPIVEAAHRAHKVAVAQRDRLLQPATEAKRTLGLRMATWDAEQARLRREAAEAVQRERERLEREARLVAEAEQRRLQEEAETRRLEEAVALEQAGDGAGAVARLEAPISTPVVVPAPIVVAAPPPLRPPKVEGVSYRVEWSAEVEDFGALVRAVAAGQQPITLLSANMAALNQLARALKGAMGVPGVRAVSTRMATVRTP